MCLYLEMYIYISFSLGDLVENVSTCAITPTFFVKTLPRCRRIVDVAVFCYLNLYLFIVFMVFVVHKCYEICLRLNHFFSTWILKTTLSSCYLQAICTQILAIAATATNNKYLTCIVILFIWGFLILWLYFGIMTYLVARSK